MPLQSPRFAGIEQLERCLVEDPAHLVVGSRGEGVRRVQEALIDLGESLPKFGADGAYGRETQAAVVQYKTDRGILNASGKIDGIVGKKTMAALDAEFSGMPTTGGA